MCPLVSQQQSIEPCLQIVLPSWFLEGETGRQGGRKAGRKDNRWGELVTEREAGREGNSWRESVVGRERFKFRELVTDRKTYRAIAAEVKGKSWKYQRRERG